MSTQCGVNFTYYIYIYIQVKENWHNNKLWTFMWNEMREYNSSNTSGLSEIFWLEVKGCGRHKLIYLPRSCHSLSLHFGCLNFCNFVDIFVPKLFCWCLRQKVFVFSTFLFVFLSTCLINLPKQVAVVVPIFGALFIMWLVTHNPETLGNLISFICMRIADERWFFFIVFLFASVFG